VSHQDGFGNNRSEPAGSTKPDDDNDGVQKKSENVAHAEDGISLKGPKNSGNLRNSPPTRCSECDGDLKPNTRVCIGKARRQCDLAISLLLAQMSETKTYFAPLAGVAFR
jgi:hypothetical protein